MDNNICTQELVTLASSLAELVIKDSVTAIATKIKTLKEEKDNEKIKNAYEAIINELIADREEAIRIAQCYKSNLDRVVISDEDIEHLHNTVSNILEIIKNFQTASTNPNDQASIRAVKQQMQSFEQLKNLISVDTLKTMQLLGFNYKKAIGEPLTNICAEAITRLGSKSKSSPKNSSKR